MIDSFAPIPSNLVDVLPPSDELGYPEEQMLADQEPGVLWDCCGASSRKFPEKWYIDPDDYADVARENDKNGTWALNFRDRFTNQHPTHECTCHSLDTNFSGARNKHRAIIYPDGPKKNHRYAESGEFGSVFFSCMYPYNIANPRIRGGAGVRQVLEIACNYGMMPEHTQPRDYGFKHTMPGTMGQGNTNQSSGKWVSKSQMPDGWEETAKHFKPLEVIFPESLEQAICLLLRGHFVSVGYNGHAYPWGQLTFSGDRLTGVNYPDSYNVIRNNSVAVMRQAYRGSYSIITTTQPGDWMKPAGK